MNPQSDRVVVHRENTCGSLLQELRKIWDEVGEPEIERDKKLLEIEQECMEVYGRKLNNATKYRAQLQQAIALSEAELIGICSAMGEKPHFIRKPGCSLKKEFESIIPQLEAARMRKVERKNIFIETLNQLQHISDEIYGSAEDTVHKIFSDEIYGSAEDTVHKIFSDEMDLSMKRLELLRKQLHELQDEKSKRLEQVSEGLDTLNSLCVILDIDFKHTVCEFHPMLGDSKEPKNISNNTMEMLASAIQSLQDIKMQRMLRLQGLATSLLELWILMDTPKEEQKMFQKVISVITASESNFLEPNMLSMNYINHVEEEVLRLEQLKSSKLKELVIKRRLDLDEICRKAHMVAGNYSEVEYSVEDVESGAVNPAYLLEKIDIHIAKVKEEALSRKEILEKVGKWLAACEEECWLEEYNRDDSRYNAGRGTHLALKRAEKARILVNKIPAMLEVLTSKTTAWERERGTEFLYDGVSLLSMLEKYDILSREKEQEKRRQRDHKRLQGQLMAEQEARFGSKPSPSKNRKASKSSLGSAIDRKLSLGGAKLLNTKPDKGCLQFCPGKKGDLLNKKFCHNPQPYDAPAAFNLGRRNSEIGGHPARKHISAPKAYKTDSLIPQMPLSPVTSTGSSASNVHQFTEDQRINNPTSTPHKVTSIGDQENRTPSTLSLPMLTASTPVTPRVTGTSNPTIRKIIKTEYSFEEIRAGFIHHTLL